MTFVSYAQNFEDVLLWRALHDVEHGTYVDVGAQDPVVDSVSLAFYERGWRGIHVEPVPAYAARLREMRPDETVIEAVVTDADGLTNFFEFSETGISTGKRKIAADHSEHGYSSRQILVPGVRLDQLLRLVGGEIHWLKIDVEGMEAEVLRSWGENDLRPWILVIEATAPNSQEQRHDQWIAEVLRRSYIEVHFDGLNRYFLHESQLDRRSFFQSPPNIFDAFVVTRQHFSTAAVRGELEASEQRSTEANFRCSDLETELGAAMVANRELRATIGNLQIKLDADQEAAAALQAQLIEALKSNETAQAKIAGLYEKLSDAELMHRETIEKLWTDRQADERRLRSELETLETALQEALQEARLAASGAQTDVAVLKERLAFAERDRDEARTAVSEADRLIHRAASIRRSRYRALGEALGLANESLEMRLLRTWRRSATAAPALPHERQMNAQPLAEPAMPESLPADRRNPFLRANSLPELLSWDDLDFVRCAYVTVLGRQPDREGEGYYVHRLRRGHSKLEVLWQLRRSPEGPKHDPGIAGFDRCLRKARWERGWLGWCLRPFTGGEGDGPSWRRHRAVLNRLERNILRTEALARQLESLASSGGISGGADCRPDGGLPEEFDLSAPAAATQLELPPLSPRERKIYARLTR